MRPFTVMEYQRMYEIGILSDSDRIELIEGLVILKPRFGPAHETAISLLAKFFTDSIGARWEFRIKSSIVLADSQPEPDLAVVRGDENRYCSRHPAPRDVGLVVEISDDSLLFDQCDKSRIYARAGIPIYWIVNLVDRCVEVYTSPSGPTAAPSYANRQVYGIAESVPFELDGTSIGSVPVAEMLP